jgi:predicted DNA-binding transcriptional regulator AlpA
MTGRPTELRDPEKRSRFLDAYRLGLPIEQAAQFAGISEAIVYEWIARGENRHPAGRKPTPETRAFVEDMAHARAEQHLLDVTIIESAARGGAEIERRTIRRTSGEVEVVVRRSNPDWRAAAWLLVHRYRSLYADPQRVEVTGAHGGPIQVSAFASESELARRLEAARSQPQHLAANADRRDAR